MTVALHYTVDGAADAPVLVLGPSLGTTGEIWQPQVTALARHYRVVRYDHRGHGGSPAPPGRYRLDDLGGDVLALLETLGPDPVHLGGLSLGGSVALWVAAHAPQRVARLALLATSPRFGSPQVWAERAATVRAEGVAAIADAALERWFPPGFGAAREPDRDPSGAAREPVRDPSGAAREPDRDPSGAAREPDGDPGADRHGGVVAWARRLLVATPAEGYAACCAALETADLTPLLGKVAAPTLIVAGADDPASPPAHAEQLAAGIPAATRVEVVPDAAHLVNVAQPETVNRLLLDFLREETSS